MFRKISFISILSISFSYGIGITYSQPVGNSIENNTIIEETTDLKVDLNTKLIATDWISWIEKFGKKKNIDRINKKKIYSGAELIAENISKKRAVHLNEITMNEEEETYTTSWKLKEQETTMKMIGTKLSSMTFLELIEIYNKYGKKEEVKK